MSAEHLARLEDSYNGVIRSGQNAIFLALDRASHLSKERREQYLQSLNKLDQMYRSASGGQSPKQSTFFPVGPHPGHKMVCNNCGAEYAYDAVVFEGPLRERIARGALFCCDRPSIPGTEKWMGLWCILCLQQYFPSRHNYTRHPLRCPDCAKRYANRQRQRRFRST